MALDLAALGAKALLAPILSELAKTASSPFKAKITDALKDARMRRVASALSSVDKVTTLMDPERQVRLKDFYIPPKFSYGRSGKSFEAASFEDFGGEDNLIIEATAGHGKSMFSRFLSVAEVTLKKRVPLLLELRKMRGVSLASFIEAELDALGFPEPQYVFDRLSTDGKFLLLLDGRRYPEIE